jgi:hypothetical protein
MTAIVCSSQWSQFHLYSIGICRFITREISACLFRVSKVATWSYVSLLLLNLTLNWNKKHAVVPITEKCLRYDCLSRARISQRFARLQGGRQSLQHDHRPGRRVSAQFSEYVDKPHAIVMQDRRIKTRLLAESLGVGKEAARQILEGDL